MPDTRNASCPHYTLYGPAFKADPFPVYATLRSEAPVCYHAGVRGTNMVWFVSRYAEARRVLRDHEHFVKDYRNALPPTRTTPHQQECGLFQGITQHLLRRDAHEHRRVRGLLEPAFRGPRVASMEPRIRHIANALLDELQPRGRMDLIRDYAFPLSTQVIAERLGVPTDDLSRFRRWTRALSTAPMLDESTRRDAIAQRRAFIAYLRHYFEARRNNPRPDLISHLVLAEQAGHLNETELFSTVALLCVAGHETTVKLIGNALLALLQHPAQYDRLHNHPELLDHAIEELARYGGSVERATTRYAADDVELCGEHIRPGDAVVVILASANRDEHAFDGPDRLDLTRTPDRHLAFGYGPHYCLGASLARLEVRVALETLLQRLPRLRLAVPVASLEWTVVPALRGLCRLPLRWE